MVRDATKALLERQPDFRVTGTAGDGATALTMYSSQQPDVVLLDVRLPDTSGVAVARQLRATNPQVAIVVLTGHADPEYRHALLRTGIMGYLSKSVSGDEIVRAIRLAVTGEAVLPDSLSPGEPSGLTARELEVLRLVTTGLPNVQIAGALGLSTRTVEVHLGHILVKLGARSRVEAITIARDRGVLTESDA